MAFFDAPRFPDALAVDAQPAFGAIGGPGFTTLLSESPGSHELRSARILQDLEVWEIGLTVKDGVTTQTLVSFFNAIAKGRANSFRFRAPSAETHSVVNEFIGTGNGAITTYQLRRLYTAGAETYEKTIYKPVPGTLSVTLNGVLTTAYVADYTTGRVVFTTAPGSGVQIRASFDYDIPVRFDADELAIRRIDPDRYNWDSIRLVEIRLVLTTPGGGGEMIELPPPGMLPPFPAVTKYVDLQGSLTSVLLINRLLTNAVITGAKSVTLCCVVSHVTNTERLFALSQESATLIKAGILLTLTPTGLTAQMGAGAANFSSLQVGPQYFCNAADPQPSASDDLFLVGLHGSTDLRIYVVTYDWGNNAIYASGSLQGYQTHSPLAYNTCQETTGQLTPPILTGFNATSYIGRNGGGALAPGGGPAGGDVTLSQDTGIGLGLVARLYELMVCIDTSGALPATIVQYVHAPLLEYFASVYGLRVTPGGLNILANPVLWYRADSNTVTVDLSGTNAVQTWNHIIGSPSAQITNPNIVAGAPIQVNLATLPPLTDLLQLAEVPG